MVWTLISGAIATTATIFGGDVMQKINNMFSGVDVSDTVTINPLVTWTFQDNSLTVSGTGFTNAGHAHLAANSGGQITEASISDLQSYLLPTSNITELNDVSSKSGTGTVVLFQGSPVLTTPTIASFVNSTHDHLAAAGGGTITEGSISDLQSYLLNITAENITDLSDVTAKAGSGTTVVFDTSPTIVTPTIASFLNAGHTHLNAAGGGTITAAAVSDLATASIVWTNKSYDLGGTGNVLTGSLAEFNTALQADTFVTAVDNLTALSTSTIAELNTHISDATVIITSNNITSLSTANSAEFNASNSDGDFFLNADNISQMATSTKAQFNTANSEDSFGYLGTAQTWTLTNTFAALIHTGRHQYDKGANVASVDAVTLGTDGNVFEITGTTTINHILNTDWQIGSEIILYFQAATPLNHLTGGLTGDEADLALQADSNYTTSIGDVLTFVLRTATVWEEISRNKGGSGAGDMVLADVQTVTGAKTFGTIGGAVGKLILAGSTSGSSILNAAAVAGSTTFTLPLTTDTLMGKATVDAMTNKSYDSDGTGNVLTNVGSSEIKSDIITGFSTVTGVSGDFVLISDTGDSGNLKAVDVADFLGGGEFTGPMTAAHDYAGFNIEFKTSTPITLGQGATDVLTATFLDDVLDAGVSIQNSDGGISFYNASATVGDNQATIKIDSGGATTIQSMLIFEIDNATDSGTTPAGVLMFQDSLGGGPTRPLMSINSPVTEFVRLVGGAEWTWHTATIFTDINTINFVGNTNTDLTPTGFGAVTLGLAADEAITWVGAADSTPNAIGFTDSDAFRVVVNNTIEFQVLAAQVDMGGNRVTGSTGYEMTGGGTVNMWSGDVDGLIAKVDTNDDFRVTVNGSPELIIDAAWADFQGNVARALNGIYTSDSDELLLFTNAGAAAVNFVRLTNSLTGVGPTFEAEGGDTFVDLNLSCKISSAAGHVNIVEDGFAKKKWLTSKSSDKASNTTMTQENGNLQDVTGTTTLNHFQDTDWNEGSVVHWKFDSAITIGHNTATPPASTSAFDLEGGVDFVAEAGDKLSLYYDASDDRWIELSRSSRVTPGLVMVDATDIALATGTGTKIGTATSQKLGFYNATPVTQRSATTAAETTITFVDENTPDFTISSLTTTSAAGFSSLDEAQAFVEVVENLQIRVLELEAIISDLGLSA